MPPPQVLGARSGITEEAAQVKEQGNQPNDCCDQATASIFPPKPLIAIAHLHTIARLALRDSATTLELDLRKGAAPTHLNGARTLAHADGGKPSAWVSREHAAASLGSQWGQAAIRISTQSAPLTQGIDLDSLLPPSGTQYLEMTDQLDGDLVGFGRRFAALLLPPIRMVGGSGCLVGITYSDRYLQTPLTVRLLAEAARGLRDALGGDGDLTVQVVTNPLRKNERQPFAPDHDWQYGEDRDEVLIGLLEQAGFNVNLADSGAVHGRAMSLHFANGNTVRVVLDQGFGPWRAPKVARFDFGVDAATQLTRLSQFNAIISARGAGYAVVTT